MLKPLSSDSDLNLSFSPISGNLNAAPQLPIFDIDSEDFPLPPTSDSATGLSTQPLIGDFSDFAAPQLPTFDDLERQAAQKLTDAPKAGAKASIWLEGDVLMIACPDCRAPLAVRVWLMAADCWNCGISIELSEDQEREAQRLMAERDQQRQQQATRPAAAKAAMAQPKQPTPPAAPKPAATAARASAPPAGTGTKPNGSPPSRPDAPAAPEPRREPVAAQVTAAKGTSPVARQSPPSGLPVSATPSAAPSARRHPPAAPAQSPPTAPRRAPTTAKPSRLQSQLRKKVQTNSAQVWISERIKETPAWLLSMIIHLVMLTLLGLLTFDEDEEGPFITISSAVSRDVKEGEANVKIDPNDDLNFDLPITEKDREKLSREALVKADQEARQLQLDSADAVMQLAPVEAVKEKLKTGSVATRALAARDPRLRVEVVKQEGGTTLTEAAVSRGLRWLASQQKPDGRWQLDGGIRSDPAATSLALLPFLGAGQTHLVGRYQNNVSKGLRWLVTNQKPDGDLSAGSSGNSRMYAHGQSAIVLCEAFAMTGDEELRVPAQKAIDFIVKAQHSQGGWRYTPGEAGDTSVVGWQVMALQSARAANLSIRSPIGIDVMAKANDYLDSVAHKDGSQYSYMPRNAPTHVMTAEGLLCRMYLGWTKSDPGLVRGVEYLNANHLPSNNQPDFYYWYYGTQVFHHSGGQAWENWNLRMREILVDRQLTSGNNAGSWNPDGPHAQQGGRIYVTSLAICTLEVYYRHTPIFRQLDLE